MAGRQMGTSVGIPVRAGEEDSEHRVPGGGTLDSTRQKKAVEKPQRKCNEG